MEYCVGTMYDCSLGSSIGIERLTKYEITISAAPRYAWELGRMIE